MHPQKRNWLSWCTLFFLTALVFIIPIEHKYDKVFRFFSKSLLPPGLPKDFDYKIFFYASDLIALALVGIALWLGKAKEFFTGRSTLWLWMILGLAALSIVTSPFTTYLFPYTRLFQLLTPIALFSFLSFGLEDKEREKVHRILLMALVIAALFQSCVAIGQYFTQGSLGLRLLGEGNLSPSPAHCATFRTAEGHRWIFDLFFAHTSPNKEVLRAYGTFSHPNILGGFLFCSILASYALWSSSERHRFWAAAIPLQSFALWTTYSRSALFALFIASALWFFLMRKEKVRTLAIWVVSSTLLCFVLLFDQYTDRGGLVNYNKAVRAGDKGRIVYQKTAFRMIESHPLTGVGYTQFSLRSPAYFPADKDPAKFPSTAHNIFLFLAAELGIPALIAFLIFIATVLRSYLIAPKNPQMISLFALFIGLLFIGLCDFYPLFAQQGKLLFFLAAGLMVSHARALSPRNLENVQRPIADL